MNFNNNIYFWEKLTDIEKKNVLNRPIFFINKKLKNNVFKILKNIRKFGDSYIYKYNFLFDNFNINKIKINCNEIDIKEILVEEKFKNAVLHAKKNIEKFHLLQKKNNNINVTIENGINCRYLETPISNIGIYIPKGINSNLISTMLMLCIPANIVGCKNIVVCSPPKISNELLYTAKICNINSIFQVGGAQAIGSMAFGTKTIPKVNKIFGPGNAYVTEAKIQVSKMNIGVSIDMPAGPTELLIISDKNSNPKFISSDLIAQLEHGEDSHAILLTNSFSLIKNVIKEIKFQLIDFPRKEILTKSLYNSKFILEKNLFNCIKISNIYSPEHLCIYSKNYKDLLKNVKNAGSVFLGEWSPEVIGDYVSGSNHVLPTYGYSSSLSGIGLKDFVKNITIQEINYKGFLNVYNTVSVMSKIEGLEGHRRSMKIRKKYLEENKNFEL
ncbi:histidinol dehydrogenase [Buchnera aphidicola (Ceratovacuna keduensis)]|uniref:histidinol dehydrogenase n=1 Tax=Buchnera aphidicola TaxID=9 RepID=UPI0031B7F567